MHVLQIIYLRVLHLPGHEERDLRRFFVLDGKNGIENGEPLQRSDRIRIDRRPEKVKRNVRIVIGVIKGHGIGQFDGDEYPVLFLFRDRGKNGVRGFFYRFMDR